MNSTLQSIHFTPAYERVPMALFDPAEERRALADLELLQTTTIIDPHTCISAQDAASGIQANLFPGHRATNPTMMREDLSKQSLNTLIVSSSVLISPLWSMSQIPEVAKNPLMRIATYVACISCLAALATSCILRIRLMFVANAAGTASQKGNPSERTIMSVSSVPLALLCSTIALFVLVLLGFTWGVGSQMPEDLTNLRLNSTEQFTLVIFGMIAFVSTCSTTVASFVPAHEEFPESLSEKGGIYYEDHQ